MDRVPLQREMGAPLHHQIYLVLADGISAGRYGVGEPLPTESQMVEKLFGYSVQDADQPALTVTARLAKTR